MDPSRVHRLGYSWHLARLQYWSVTEGGWRTLTRATALDSPDLGYPRPNFTRLPRCGAARRCFSRKRTIAAAGDVIYRMQSPTMLVVAIENVNSMQATRSPLRFLQRLGPMSGAITDWLGRRDHFIIAGGPGDYVNRAKAFYHFVGLPNPPP